MPDSPNTTMTKHLARNVPVNFAECVERERLSIAGDLRRRGRRKPEFTKLIAMLFDETVADADETRLYREIVEVQLRYLVLAKTLDQSVPPTPIKMALKSLHIKAEKSLETLRDPDRDEVVNGYRDEGSLGSTRADFDNANSFAEKASIAFRMVESFSRDLKAMSEFFDYKAGLTPRGNTTQFAMIYAISALADLFERENTKDRSANVNMGIRLNEEDEQGDWLRYTGLFLAFAVEFFRRVDDSQIVSLEGDSLSDRIRKLARSRKNDPGLFQLLHGDVQVETMLEFMRRAERVR